MREFVVETLREEGFDVIHAANGEEALAWCGRRVVDVLVTDIKLPGNVDGWQIAEHCREHDPEVAGDLLHRLVARSAASCAWQPSLA
jgi:CheY-like chemotaxis protein